MMVLAVAFIAVGGFLAIPSTAEAAGIASDTWYLFTWGGVGPDDPVSPFGASPAMPWEFTAPAIGATIIVTDMQLDIDQFELFDFGTSIGQTSAPAWTITACGSDPDVCLAHPLFSHGYFYVGAGNHSITMTHLQGTPGLGALRWEAGDKRVPAPAAAGLMALGLVGAALRRRRSS
jgi:hypothetical protein